MELKQLRGLFALNDSSYRNNGKLVLQDASEEPASEVVVRCEKERKALADSGKLSNRKRLPEVFELALRRALNEFVAPLGWEWVRFDRHICDHFDWVRCSTRQRIKATFIRT